MNLELLPNEIFLDLFDYFDGTDLLRAFYGLNSRFNVLLHKQFRSYRFQFESVSKRYFNVICQQHLPFIGDQVITLLFSNHWQTPGQINLFFSYIPSLCQFTQLRSLTLFDFHLYDIFLTLLDQCQHLSHFTRLNLYFCSFSNASFDCQLVSNKIWSLPKLTNYSFHGDSSTRSTFYTPTTISTSLQCITLYSLTLKWNRLWQLFEYTPCLKHLSTSIDNYIDNDYIAHPHPALHVPNLRHLDVTTLSQLIYGHQWEEIIRNHLLKLKTLRLQMEESFYNNENIQEEADNLLNSFRNSFWTDEHQWFVRCMTTQGTIYLQTLCSPSTELPKILGYSVYTTYGIPNSWQSTDPHDNQQEIYNTVTNIWDKNCFDRPISSDIRLHYIEYLHIKLPINDQFWSTVPSLDKLHFLSVSSHADIYQSQLQTLLDRAPHLHTLHICQDALLPLQMSLFKYIHTSVRRLYIHDYNHDFDEEECLHLTGSPLGIQCEDLWIRVTNRRSIIYLDKTMLHLRSLTVKCADDKYCKRTGLRDHTDELVRWLKRRLSSLYMIVRDAEHDSKVLLWM